MAMDALSPVAPARVRCLLLPYGRITRPRFLEFVERLQKVITVRLGDISPNGNSDRNMFSPLAFPNGNIVYDLTTSATTPSHRSLVPFELYRETLAVVAIGDGQEYVSRASEEQNGNPGSAAGVQQLSKGLAEIKESFPSSFVHQIFCFDCEIPKSALSEGIFAVPPKEKSKPTTLKTIMCDLTSILLAEMTTFARSVQALPNLEIPKTSQVDGVQSPGGSRNNSRPGSRASNTTDSRAQSPINDGDRHAHRASMPAHLLSSTSKSGIELGRSRSAVEGTKTPPVTFDQMNNLPDRPSTSTAELGARTARDRVSVHGFGPGSVGERARNQAKSRIGVVIGSMHLLSGRWSDALKELTESAIAAKANSDYAWHAKALDYLLVTVLMYAWAGMDFDIPQILYPFGEKIASIASKASKQSFMADNGASEPATNRAVSLQNLCGILPDLANNILNLYGRAAQFSGSPVPQIIFSDTTIRLSKLLSLVHDSFGAIEDYGLRWIVVGGTQNKSASLPEHTLPFPSKADIASLLYRAYPAPSMEDSVDILDRISILAGIASVLSSLDLHRKKAFVLRELLSSLLPALVQSRKHSAAEQGVHPAASLSTFDLAGGEVNVSGVLGKHDGTDHGIQGFVILLCEVYGIILTSAVSSSRETVRDTQRENEDNASIAARCVQSAIRRTFGSPGLKLDIMRTCINICEALPDLRGVLRFSSDLLNTAGSGVAPGPTTTDSSPRLPIEDQARLANNISRTVGAASQLGFANLEAEYWDEFLLRDLEVMMHNAANTPLARSKAELKLASGDIEKKDGPFIYNPFAKPASVVRETILIAKEETTFVILLQNLYDFELEIEWIKLDVSEVLLEAKTEGVIIGAYRTQQINIPAIPLTSGMLTIDACIAKVKGCRARRFPLFRTQWRMRDEVKVKRHGLTAATIPKDRPISTASEPGKSKKPSETGLPVSSSFEARIINTQPTISLRSMSLPQAALMILEGETRRFSVTLENTSQTAIDLLLLSTTDSSSEALQAGLDDNNLTPAELYEGEIGAVQKPAVRILPHNSGTDLGIPSNGTLTMDMEVTGKIGLTHATLKVEYGFLGVPRSEVDERFYTRQLSIPISVSVSPSAGLVHNDVLPFTGDFAWTNQLRNKELGSTTKKTSDSKSPEQRFQGLLKRLGLGGQGESHCLVVLDFYNSWSTPISLSLQVRSQLSQSPSEEVWNRAYSVHEVLQPGHSTRVLVLLPRLILSSPHAPIPSLRNKRQFVVSASKISPDFERLTREMFWYREEALKYMRATWSEVRSTRSGEIDLRRLKLDPRMLDTLKLEEVGIDMALVPTASATSDPSQDESNTLRQISRTRFSVPTSTFFNLTATLKSRLSQPIYPLLRIQPALRNQPYNVALDLNKKLAFNGVLQRPLTLLKPGEQRTVSLGVIFLAAGQYEFGACIEELRVWRDRKAEEATKTRPRAMTGELRAEDLIRTDRRTWFAKEVCSVDVDMPELGEG